MLQSEHVAKISSRETVEQERRRDKLLHHMLTSTGVQQRSDQKKNEVREQFIRDKNEFEKAHVTNLAELENQKTNQGRNDGGGQS